MIPHVDELAEAALAFRACIALRPLATDVQWNCANWNCAKALPRITVIARGGICRLANGFAESLNQLGFADRIPAG